MFAMTAASDTHCTKTHLEDCVRNESFESLEKVQKTNMEILPILKQCLMLLRSYKKQIFTWKNK